MGPFHECRSCPSVILVSDAFPVGDNRLDRLFSGPTLHAAVRRRQRSLILPAFPGRPPGWGKARPVGAPGRMAERVPFCPQNTISLFGRILGPLGAFQRVSWPPLLVVLSPMMLIPAPLRRRPAMWNKKKYLSICASGVVRSPEGVLGDGWRHLCSGSEYNSQRNLGRIHEQGQALVAATNADRAARARGAISGTISFKGTRFRAT